MTDCNIHNSKIEQLNNQGNNIKIVSESGNNAVSEKGKVEEIESTQALTLTEPITSPSSVMAATKTTTSFSSGQPVTPQLAPTAPNITGPVRLFYSYSHKDEALRDELEEALALLKRQGLISGWHDRRIGAGDEWKGAIDKNLEEAQVILLLVSSSFLASDYCWDVETKRAVERHDRGEAKVIPVVLRPCDWHGAPFGKLQALPKDGKAVTSWANKDEAWTDVAKGIRQAVEAMTQNPR
jgi:hypothetical protein